MKNNKANLLSGIYDSQLEIISGIKFTPREIDVIACLLGGRTTKTICQFLSIEEKTVETHKYNVMRKLDVNSKESIIDFIEKSDKFSAVKKHYLGLLIQNLFVKRIQEISSLPGKKGTACSIVYWREQEQKKLLVNQLEKHLNLAGVKVSLQVRENYKSLNHLVHNLESQASDYVLYIVPEILLEQLRVDNDRGKLETFPFIQKASQNPGSVIFLLGHGDAAAELPSEIQDVGYINFKAQENYYFSIFEILKKMMPDRNLDKIIGDFRKQYETTCSSSEILPTQMWPAMEKSTEKPSKNERREPFLGDFPIKSIQSSQSQDFWVVRSDLPIPTDNTLLDRPKILAKIEEKFKGQGGIQVVALTGIGGSGKTTLARQYAHDNSSSVVWEINAETKESLVTSFENLAYALSQTEEEKRMLKNLQDIKNPTEQEKKIITFIKERLKSHRNWFLIFDNVEKFGDIQQYFPSDSGTWGTGKIIVTTRDANIQNNRYINHALFIEELDQEEKLQLFMSIMNNEKSSQIPAIQGDQTKEFLEPIPPFPLDVSIAAYYLKTTDIPCDIYLKNIKKYNADFEVMQERIIREVNSYTKTRYNIISLSIKQLINIHIDFENLLFFISILDSQCVQRSLLDSYKDSSIIDRFIYSLKQYSLINNTLIPLPCLISGISIHRSTQEIILDYFLKNLEVKKKNLIIESIFNTLKNYTMYAFNKADYMTLTILLRHYESINKNIDFLSEERQDYIRSKLGNIYFYLGCYIKSIKTLEEYIQDVDKKKTKDLSVFSEALVYLGMVYRKFGDYEKSKSMLERGILTYKTVFPEKKLKLAWSLGNLGVVYRNLGDYERAKNFFEQSLFIYKKNDEIDNISIAWVLAHLGNLCIKLGNFENAEKLLQESLMTFKENLPEKHIEIAWVSAHLGNLYRNLGNWEKAKNLLKQSIKMYEDQFGKDHIDVSWVLAHLGRVYSDLGYYKKALNLFQRSLDIQKSLHTQNHIRLAWVSTLLGKALKDIKCYEQAKFFLEKSVEAHTNHFGKTHFFTAWSLKYLGEFYKDMGDYEKAESILKKIVKIYTEKFGKDNIKTARVIKNLGDVHLLRGDIVSADNLLTRTLVIFRENKHIEIYKILESLSDLFLRKSIIKNNGCQDIYKNQAIDYLNQALEATKRNFPKNSPHIIRIQAKLQNFSSQQSS